MALRALARLRNTWFIPSLCLFSAVLSPALTTSKSIYKRSCISWTSRTSEKPLFAVLLPMPLPMKLCTIRYIYLMAAGSKLQNQVLSSDNNIAHVMEDAVVSDQGEDTQFEASMKVEALPLRFIIGRRRTKKRIEMATRTQIIIPRTMDLKIPASLLVKGASRESVDAAIRKVQAVLQGAEKSQNVQYSHFISLPLSSQQALVEQLRSFKEYILAEEKKVMNYVSWFPETAEKEISSVPTINTTSNKVTKIKSSYILDPDLECFFSDDESSDDDNERPGSKSSKINEVLFLKPETAHITVLMLKLFTNDHVNAAGEVLQGIKPKVLEILDGQEPKVVLKGIECLRGIPSKARVLSMKVQEADNGNCLQRACQAIKDAYAEAGLVAEPVKKQEIKLHATLMNTSFTRRLGSKPFDARKILAKYQAQEWGEYTINEVHLSQRYLYDESGYYHCCGSFQLPTTLSQSSIQAG